jgi:hypothetical protein
LSVLSGSLLRMSSETGRLIWLAAHQRGVLSRAQVLSGAITVDGLRHRIRKGADSLRERTGASEPEAGSHPRSGRGCHLGRSAHRAAGRRDRHPSRCGLIPRWRPGGRLPGRSRAP